MDKAHVSPCSSLFVSRTACCDVAVPHGRAAPRLCSSTRARLALRATRSHDRHSNVTGSHPREKTNGQNPITGLAVACSRPSLPKELHLRGRHKSNPGLR